MNYEVTALIFQSYIALLDLAPCTVSAGCRVFLMPRLAGGGIVRDDHHAGTLVVNRVDQPGDAGMHKGGVADDGDGLLGEFPAPGFFAAVGHADGRAHADDGVRRAQRRHRAEGIAPDVRRNAHAQLVQGVEQPPVGAAGAEHRRPDGDVLRLHGAGVRRAGKKMGDLPGEKLALNAGFFLAKSRKARGFDRFFEKGLAVLDHRQLFHVV